MKLKQIFINDGIYISGFQYPGGSGGAAWGSESPFDFQTIGSSKSVDVYPKDKNYNKFFYIRLAKQLAQHIKLNTKNNYIEYSNVKNFINKKCQNNKKFILKHTIKFLELLDVGVI